MYTFPLGGGASTGSWGGIGRPRGRSRAITSRSKHFLRQLLPAKSISAGNYFPLKAFLQAITSHNRIGYREVALMKTIGNVRTIFGGI